MNDGMVPSIITKRPDVNSAEAILYGKEYLSQKSADWYWNAVEDELKKELEENKRRIRDPVFASMVLNTRSSMIFATNPPVSDVNQMRDLLTLRKCVKTGTALRDLNLRKKNNELYFRMKGINQYTERLMESGISDSTWRVATNNKNEPINYDLVRGLMEDDELKAAEDAREYAIELDAYKADRDKFAKDMEEYRRSVGDDTSLPKPDVDAEDAETEEEIPDFPIYIEIPGENDEGAKEKKMLDPNSDEFWEDDYYEDDAPVSADYVNGLMHHALQYSLADWCADDVEWFLTEVAE